ncbi:uncharacterized protein TRUGW13939_10249 [Talaromyces rugulosus]|uniref:Uncharacterized protein n=1 Tax=Talaromyces rugulosus TaxID=121627 RepID=A0A7H8RBB1_TALRU|nr:uncharacterized protein TRUGW13939_10249 [Talaromyces rugulosus]QKX63081.1 hypothetical protein TRUGW13939_10249 [Talaromyces rugulosus]
MDLGISKVPFRLKDWVVDKVPPESLKEQQTMHFIQLQRFRDLVTTRLYSPSDQDKDEDRHGFIMDMAHRLENWKMRAQQLAAADIHTANLWELWHSGTTLRLLRPLLQQHPVVSNNLQRCYSLSTETIDISFTQLFIRRHTPVTYSWKDICDIILAGVTFLYVISTSKEVIEDDASFLGRRFAKFTAILKTALQNWPNAARAQSLLVSLTKHTMDNIHSRGADDQGEQQRLSKRPRITPDTNEASNLPCPDGDDGIDLPVPRAKVRRGLAHRDSESEVQSNASKDGLEDSFFTHEFVERHRVRIMSTILGLNPPQIEGEHGMGTSCDGMNDYMSFLEFVDVLHCGAVP